LSLLIQDFAWKHALYFKRAHVSSEYELNRLWLSSLVLYQEQQQSYAIFETDK